MALSVLLLWLATKPRLRSGSHGSSNEIGAWHRFKAKFEGSSRFAFSTSQAAAGMIEEKIPLLDTILHEVWVLLYCTPR
jgi:hypothetical protein